MFREEHNSPPTMFDHTQLPSEQAHHHPNLRLVTPASDRRLFPLQTQLAQAFTLERFQFTLAEHAKQIRSATNLAFQAYIDAGKLNRLAPEHCNRVIAALDPLDDSIEQIGGILGQVSRLPFVAIPLRYPLVVAIYDLSDRIRRFVVNLTPWCERGRLSARVTTHQHVAVQRQFERIVEYGNDVAAQADQLLDQTRFQELRLHR